MRPPRLRCTLFPLIYPPHLLGSYKRQLYGFVLFSRLTKRNLASYVISVRRTKSLLTASFRFYLTIDTLAVQLYTSSLPRRVRDFHPLERTHGAQTKNSGVPVLPCGSEKRRCAGRYFISSAISSCMTSPKSAMKEKMKYSKTSGSASIGSASSEKGKPISP